MNLFEYFFTNKAYLPADLPGRLFSPLHIAVMIILTVAVPLVAFLLRKMDKKKMKILFIVLWAVMVVAEGAKITWESLTNPNGFEVTGILPLYICSIFMYVMPFAIWGGRRASLVAQPALFYARWILLEGLSTSFILLMCFPVTRWFLLLDFTPFSTTPQWFLLHFWCCFLSIMTTKTLKTAFWQSSLFLSFPYLQMSSILFITAHICSSAEVFHSRSFPTTSQNGFG